jgi:competence protein ComEC
MRATAAVLTALLLCAPPLRAQAGAAKPLDIYFIDTEGGQATLFVAPSGESVLIDTGNPGARDLDRILATLAEAGVSRLDHLLLTHYHVDHIGGVQELAKRIPIANFVDHGPSVEPNEQVAGFQAAYAELYGKATHTVVKPGDRLSVAGLDWRIASAGGQVLRAPLPGAGQPNPACASFERKEITNDPENAQSVGSVVSLGKFRTVDLGDLLWNVEFGLVCPANRLGTVDLYITSHHGLAQSGSPALVHALRPRVAVMNNGTRKGGAVQTFQTLHLSPGLEDLWQLHWSYAGGVEHNSPGVFIANLDDAATVASVLTDPAARPAAHAGAAYLIKVSARADGSFTVTNTRNGFTKRYAARP